MKATSLKRVPTFTFIQDNGEEFEQPLTIAYYNGSVGIEQGAQEVILMPSAIKPLFQAILKNMPEANEILSK